MTTHDIASALADAASEASKTDAVARHRDLLVRLVDVATSGAHGEDVPDAALRAICDALELNDGLIALIDDAGRRLVPAAAFGAHATLLREGPPIDISSDYEAARAVREGRAAYTSQIYADSDGGNQAGESEGTARWRDAIAVHSSAIIPLMLGGRAVGTMTLRWPEPQPFDETMRELLETISALVALAVEHERYAGATATDTPPRPATTTRLARLEITSAGIVVPRPRDANWSGTEQVRVSVSAETGRSDTVFHDVASLGRGRFSLLLARVSHLSGSPVPEGFEEALRQTSRAFSARAHDVTEAAVALNGAVAVAVAAGTVVDAWIGVLEPQTGALAWCAAGDVETLLHGSDGRAWHALRHGPPLGSSANATYPSEVRLLMPGDELAISVAGRAELRVERMA